MEKKTMSIEMLRALIREAIAATPAPDPDPNCPECQGTGLYHGLNSMETCQTCLKRSQVTSNVQDDDKEDDDDEVQYVTKTSDGMPAHGMKKIVDALHAIDYKGKRYVIMSDSPGSLSVIEVDLTTGDAKFVDEEDLPTPVYEWVDAYCA